MHCVSANLGAQQSRGSSEVTIKKWMEMTERRDRKRYGMDPSYDLARKVLSLHGWACWSTLTTIAVNAEDTTVFRMKAFEHHKILDMCGGLGAVGSSPPLRDGLRVVINRHHNGFGNQMFQYVFSRLLAESLGYDWKTTIIQPRSGESPRNDSKMPPNTGEGWLVFQSVFGTKPVIAVSATGEGGDHAASHVEDICKNASDTVLVADRPWEMRTTGGSLSGQLLRALVGVDRHKRCLKMIGYFQEGLYLMPVRNKIMSWFDSGPSTRPARYPVRYNSSVVVHVRNCGGGKWHYLPFRYYDVVLRHLKDHHIAESLWRRTEEPFEVFIVTHAGCKASELVSDLASKYHAKVITGQQGVAGIVFDFQFLMHAPRLLLGKSTFGFWAGYLSQTASEIHMPIEYRGPKNEKIPIIYDDNRFIYHRLEGFWFGQYRSDSMSYEFQNSINETKSA
jgi:hypothetical protein